MARSCSKSFALAAAIVVLTAVACGAFQLIAPTEGQAVRENVRIELPASVVPEDGFISVLVSETGTDRFVVALSRSSAKLVGSNLVFYWNTKAPYYDPKAEDPMKPKQFKDGRYPITVQVHWYDADPKKKSMAVDKATVNIELKNRVPRTNPAPGIVLSNSLAFGQRNDYRIHSDVSVSDVVNGMSLPLLGGLGMSADSLVVQTVEDVRSGPQYLLRYVVDDKTYVAANGYKKYIYAGQELKPQLYRLMDRHGNVLKANMFTKQARYQIMDILPVLPSGPVKEGDSWADNMTLKIDGLTGLIRLKGSAMLDSFEWQNGRECAKITSMLSGTAPISLVNGKIRGSGIVNADVTTYFAYKSGRMLQREIMLTTDAVIMPGAGDTMTSDAAANAMMSAPPGGGVSPYDDPTMTDAAPVFRPVRPGGTTPGGMPPGMGSPTVPGGMSTPDNTNKKGKVEFYIVVRLEK